MRIHLRKRRAVSLWNRLFSSADLREAHVRTHETTLWRNLHNKCHGGSSRNGVERILRVAEFVHNYVRITYIHTWWMCTSLSVLYVLNCAASRRQRRRVHYKKTTHIYASPYIKYEPMIRWSDSQHPRSFFMGVSRAIESRATYKWQWYNSLSLSLSFQCEASWGRGSGI